MKEKTLDNMLRMVLGIIVILCLFAMLLIGVSRSQTREDPIARTHITGMSEYSTRWRK